MGSDKNHDAVSSSFLCTENASYFSLVNRDANSSDFRFAHVRQAVPLNGLHRVFLECLQDSINMLTVDGKADTSGYHQHRGYCTPPRLWYPDLYELSIVVP